MDLSAFPQLLVTGILTGSVYAIIAMGLTLIFGVVRVINFAHGEFLMVAMYGCYILVALVLLPILAPEGSGGISWLFIEESGRGVTAGLLPYLLAPLLVVALFFLGAATQRFIIQPLLNADPHIQIFATVGISTALINLALLLFSADLQSIQPGALREYLRFDQQNLSFLSWFAAEEGGRVRLRLNTQMLWPLVASILLLGALHLFLTRTMTGRAMRATAQNRNAAQLMGIDVRWIYILAFGLGSACVGLAGSLMLPVYPVTPQFGALYVLTAFVIVVLGGMGSVIGAFVGAMIIGLVESFVGFYAQPDLAKVASFSLFLIILILRPTGLFGLGRGSE